MTRETKRHDRPLRDLVNHLENENHQVLRQTVFRTALQLDQTVSDCEVRYAAPIRRAFRHFSSDLNMHIEKEEHALFPLVVALEDAWLHGDPPPASVREAIDRSITDHAAIRNNLAHFRARCAAIEKTPNDLCQRLLDSVSEVDLRLQETIALEDGIAFARALALEDDFHGSSPTLTATMNKGGRP